MTGGPPRDVRWHLFQVQLVGIVPIGLLAAALLYHHRQAQEHGSIDAAARGG